MWAVWSLAYPSILGGLTEGRASCLAPMCCSHGRNVHFPPFVLLYMSMP
jgi:hypothetical protein